MPRRAGDVSGGAIEHGTRHDPCARVWSLAASDVHLKVGRPPCSVSMACCAAGGRGDARRSGHGSLRRMPARRLPPRAVPRAPAGRPRLRHPGNGRFRVNIFHQRGELSIALRVIPPRVRTIREFNLPPVVERIALERRGLILVTGTTGSGKSTTLAAMIDHINQSRDRHIITIEDPIEYTHEDQQCIINQREIGYDCRDLRRRRCAARCARTPTSSWSAKCATSRPSRRRSSPPRPATW